MDPSTDNCAMSSGSHHPSEPRLCARGCGFYGTPENRGLCSKCYKDYLKSEAPRIIKEADDKQADSLKSLRISKSETNNPTVSIAKNRCLICRKRVGLLGFGCRCGGNFCGMHRYPEAHSCNQDFKTAGRTALEMENPICKADKIKDRI